MYALLVVCGVVGARAVWETDAGMGTGIRAGVCCGGRALRAALMLTWGTAARGSGCVGERKRVGRGVRVGARRE